MDIAIFIIQVLIFAAIIIAYFFIKNLLPSYFSEKGKNLATKEDIEDITKKIKTVESKINVRTNGEIDYQSLKRKIVLEYFATYNSWERLITDGNANTEINSETKNNILLQKIKDSKLQYNLKEGEIELFIEDEEFYKLRTEVTIKLLRLQQEFEMHCSQLNVIIKIETDPQARHDKIMEQTRKYNNILISKMKDIIPHRNNLIKYLEKILKESFS
ncbi:hypothetical protein [Chryseobacterium sp. ISL-6]|uniref:hypothetical protein n=1 Tax=Chryseobacterium sp. ISL-6 TaxID=2819143 RepID=UPI001BE9CF9E|nr:hypothetical protein [Chryseobacterium sp. ISL-6]MBT2620843.1 hypothetical protein [Chryseobacterium sp. ISL-6]